MTSRHRHHEATHDSEEAVLEVKGERRRLCEQALSLIVVVGRCRLGPLELPQVLGQFSRLQVLRPRKVEDELRGEQRANGPDDLGGK